MELNEIKLLNSYYENIHNRADALSNALKKAGYNGEFGYFNMHSINVDNEFYTEYFPIPVFTIDEYTDIDMNFDDTSIETTVSRNAALSVDYEELAKKYKFEVYGVENYLEDYYNENLLLSETAERIEKSKESQIHIAFDLGQAPEPAEIIEILDNVISKLINM